MPKIGLIQTFASSSIQDNLERQIHLIEEAANQQVQIVCLQELATTTYFCNENNESSFDLAEKKNGFSVQRIRETARKHNIHIIFPFFEKRSDGIYHNSVLMIDDEGNEVGFYRKMHIPDDPGFQEKYYFTPGDLGYQVFNTKFGKIAALICWDQWFPEAARIVSMMGAEIIFYPTAIGTLSEESVQDKEAFKHAWKTIQLSHAIANGVYIAAINRVGEEAGTTFWGNSFISGPFGEVLNEAGENEETLIVDVDFKQNEKQRRMWPFFRDRRIDSYQNLTKRWLD